MSDEPDNEFDRARKLARMQLMSNDTEAFAMVTFDGDDVNVSYYGDQVHEQTQMPMPQVLLAGLIYDYSRGTDVEPLRIGQAATYAAGNVFAAPQEAEDIPGVRNLADEIDTPAGGNNWWME
jgi:hypothetical protein